MQLKCANLVLDLSHPQVMGIVNVTPDSFSDGGRYNTVDNALKYAELLMEQGANILDIGGESTRPGAASVSLQQELDRVMPVLERLHGCPVPLSIDTVKPQVMSAAIQAGVHLVNDINALQDPAALQAVVNSKVAVCLMHKQGTPQTMQLAPHYQNVLEEIAGFLQQRASDVQRAGIETERIVLDPGFGFGKSLAHNLALLKRFDYFSSLGFALLAGLSRKSMLGVITGRGADERLIASVAAGMLAIQRGAHILRVHDVAATVDMIKVWSAVDQFSGSEQ